MEINQEYTNIQQSESQTTNISFRTTYNKLLHPFRDIPEIVERKRGGEDPLLNLARDKVKRHEQSEDEVAKRFPDATGDLKDMLERLTHSFEPNKRIKDLVQEGRERFPAISKEQTSDLESRFDDMLTFVERRGKKTPVADKYSEIFGDGIDDEPEFEGAGDSDEYFSFHGRRPDPEEAGPIAAKSLTINYRAVNVGEEGKTFRCIINLNGRRVSIDLQEISGIDPDGIIAKHGEPTEGLIYTVDTTLGELRSYEYQLLKFILERASRLKVHILE